MDRPFEGDAVRRTKSEQIDFLRLHHTYRDGECRFADDVERGGALARTQRFGIADQWTQLTYLIRIQDHRGGNEWTGERSPARFVNSGDARIPALEKCGFVQIGWGQACHVRSALESEIGAWGDYPMRRFRIVSDLRLFLACCLDRGCFNHWWRRNGRSHVGANVQASCRAATLADTGGTTGETTQVVELGAANLAKACDFDFVDARRMNKERSLNSNAVGGNPANGEVLIHATGAAADHDAFEDLNALAGALNNLRVNANGVARTKCRNFGFVLLRLDLPDELSNHAPCTLISYRGGKRTRSGPVPRTASSLTKIPPVFARVQR